MPATTCLPDANVRSPTYYIARTNMRCPHCGSATLLLGLAVPPGHETLQVDADEPSTRQRENANALLFYVESLSREVQDRLQALSRFYRLGFDAGANSAYWANHCEHCGALLGDHELYCEPEGAFLPSSATAATHVQFTQIREPFSAAAVGYACDPEFLVFTGGA